MYKLILFLFFDCGLCMLDFIVISSMRRFLFDFLRGNRSRKAVKKIHMQQPFIQRVTMAYIEPMLKQNLLAFRCYRKLYIVDLCTLLPQYIILIMCHIQMGKHSMYVLAFFAVIKTVIAFLIRVYLNKKLLHDIVKYTRYSVLFKYTTTTYSSAFNIVSYLQATFSRFKRQISDKF